MEKKRRDLREDVFAVLHDFSYILAVITVIFVFLVRLVGVSGPSMTPTLQNGEYVVLLSNFLCGSYRQGEIVVATVPTFDDAQPIVKRVIAVGGQTVDIDFEKGEVRVDGALLQEDYLSEPTYMNYENGLSYPVTVPDGYVFLMGDNRNHSTDSRFAQIGCVPESDILGKVILRVYPLGRIGTVS